MKDVVEFVVKMRDMVSGGMRGIATTAQTVTNRVDGNFTRMATRMRRPVQSIDVLNRKLDDLRKTRDLSVNFSQIKSANREIDKVERKLSKLDNAGKRGGSRSSSGAGGGLLDMLGGARGLAAAAGIAGIVAAGGASLGMGMQAGAQRTSFEVMGGQKEGGKLFTDLTKFANDSIFGTELYQQAQTMLAFGASVKTVMPDLKMLGDISMGNKEKLSSLTLAYSQIQATGRLMGQDLLQLVNAGFNPLQIISEKTGRSMANLKKDMEDGKIGADMVKKAFEAATGPGGRFFDMTNKIAATPFGKWEALKGQISGIATQLGTAMLPVASMVMDSLSGLANYLPAIITSLQPLFASAGQMIAPIMGLIPTLATTLRPIIDMLGAFPLQQFVADVVGLTQSILTGLAPVFTALTPIVSTVLQVVGSLTHKVFELAKPLINMLSPILTLVAKNLGMYLVPAIKVVGWALGGVIDLVTWLANKLEWLLTPITKLLQFVSNGVGDMMDSIVRTVEAKKNTIAERLKEGVSNNQIVSFFRKVGETHGDNYLTGLMSKYGMVAKIMDRMYNSNAYTTRFNQLVNQVRGIKANAKTPGTTPGGATPAFTPGGGLGNATNTSDKITGGGQRVVKIDVHKMFDNIIINAQTVNEGIEDMEQKVQEALLRILGSVNTVI